MGETETNPTPSTVPAANEGIVYVLRNPAMPDYVKIGKTNNLERRMADLDGTSVPVPFECVYAARVADMSAWEATLHVVFADERINARREFFSASVIPKVVRILATAQLENVTNTAPAVSGFEEEDARDRIARRDRFDFELLDIDLDETLVFVQDENVICRVVSQKPPRVDFRGETLTLSNATARALDRDSSMGLQGPLYWKYGSEVLTERRRRIEVDDGEES